MPPDLNSLPPSPSPSSSSPLQSRSMANTDTSHTQSPPASHTLAAAAAMNSGLQIEDNRRASSGSMRREVERARRRSSIRMNLNLNDPTVPSPGEMQSPSSRIRGPWPQSPHHERAPSLGELHQELEYEQEGQVNRLLNMIRQQQAQILTLQANQQPHSSSAVDDSTPTSERSLSLSQTHPHPTQTSQPNISPHPTAGAPRSRSPLGLGNMSRHSSIADRSRGSSHHGSPALRPTSGHGGAHETYDWLPSAATTTGRDESAFYQAETQNLTRENQMLKLRIRELERQLSDMNPTSQITHSPITASGLNSNPALSGQQDTRTTTETPGNPSTSTATAE